MKKFLTVLLALSLVVVSVFSFGCGKMEEPENPEQTNTDYSPYGIYKFYSAEDSGKIWHVGDEIDGVKITEDYWNIILAPNGKTYVSVDIPIQVNVSLVCIKEGGEYAFYVEDHKLMTITVSGDTLVGVTTNPIPETLTFKKVSDDYTVPEQINPVGGITADTDFNALESDIVSKQEFIKAFVEFSGLNPYGNADGNFTWSLGEYSNGASTLTTVKCDGNKKKMEATHTANGQKQTAFAYMILMEGYNSWFMYTSQGSYYEESVYYLTDEEINAVCEKLWQDAVYNNQNKQYEIASYIDEGTELSDIHIKIKYGHIVFFEYKDKSGNSACLKCYDIENTTVNIPASVLQKYQEILNKKQQELSPVDAETISAKIEGLFRMYSCFEGNVVIKLNEQGYIWYQENEEGNGVGYDLENQVKNVYGYYTMLDKENFVIYDVQETVEEYFTVFSSKEDMDSIVISLFNVSFDSLKSAKFYATAENNVYKCVIGSKILILTLNDEGKAVKLSTEDDSSYIKVERFGGVTVILPQEVIDYINENTKK